MLDLEAIKKRVVAARPGPWEIVPDPMNAFLQEKGSPNTFARLNGLSGGREQAAADAEFIAHAREDVPALLAELERLSEENVELRATLQSFVSEVPTVMNDAGNRSCVYCGTDDPVMHLPECKTEKARVLLLSI